ncbi:MAG: hypothetical protein WC996_01655 [Peptostreptococcales bacterium]
MSSKQGKNIKGELKIEGNLILSGITEDDSPLKILYYNDNGIVSQGLTTMKYISEDYVNDNLVVPITIGDITSGTTISSLTGKTFSEILNMMLVPTIEPYISENNSLILELTSTIDDIVEVGTPISPTINTTYNRGKITFGNNVDQIDLTGLPSQYRFKLPDGSTDQTYSTTNLSQQHVYNSYPATLGTITWSVEVDYSLGTGNYYNSKNIQRNNLDSDRVSGTIINSSDIVVNTRLYSWWDEGGTIPSNSSEIRNLPNKQFLNEDNTGEIVFRFIVETSGSRSIYFAIPKSMDNYVEIWNYTLGIPQNETNNFSSTEISVDDAGGINTIDYILYSRTVFRSVNNYQYRIFII